MLRHILLCVVALFIACALTKKSGNESCFSKVKNQVKNKWEYNKEENHYKEKAGLLSLTSPQYYDCVKTLSRRQVIKIFGRPSEMNTEKSMLTYYQMPNCNTDSKYCEKLYFKLKEGKVSDFGFAAATSKSH